MYNQFQEDVVSYRVTQLPTSKFRSLDILWARQTPKRAKTVASRLL